METETTEKSKEMVKWADEEARFVETVKKHFKPSQEKAELAKELGLERQSKAIASRIEKESHEEIKQRINVSILETYQKFYLKWEKFKFQFLPNAAKIAGCILLGLAPIIVAIMIVGTMEAKTVIDPKKAQTFRAEINRCTSEIELAKVENNTATIAELEKSLAAANEGYKKQMNRLTFSTRQFFALVLFIVAGIVGSVFTFIGIFNRRGIRLNEFDLSYIADYCKEMPMSVLIKYKEAKEKKDRDGFEYFKRFYVVDYKSKLMTIEFPKFLRDPILVGVSDYGDYYEICRWDYLDDKDSHNVVKKK